ncbi:MAG: hypothetical protein R2747_21970 [Pyrinomonadaceae bacterium]
MKFLQISLTIMIFGLGVFAQTKQEKPDFSGTWILNQETSSPDSKTLENYEDFRLVISHKDPEITIRKSYLYKNKPLSYEIILFTDKRKEVNKTPLTPEQFSEIESQTFWRKKTLFRKYESPATGNTVRLIYEKYSLSDDGKTLTISTENRIFRSGNNSGLGRSTSSSSFAPGRKLVFTKQT